MKKFIGIIVLMLSTISFSQGTVPDSTSKSSLMGVNTYPPNSAEHDSLKANLIFNDSINYQISLIDQNLNSIQIKWDWIMNNPEEKILAEDTGWFTDMTGIKDGLYLQRQILIDSIK